MRQAQILSEVIKKFCKLPEGIEFYEVDGQIIFPIKEVTDAPSEAIPASDSIIYLIKKGDYKTGKGFLKYGILLSELLKPHVEIFMKHIADNTAGLYDQDGGSLESTDNEITIKEVKKLDHPLE